MTHEKDQHAKQATIAPILLSNDAVSIQPNGRGGQPLIIIRFASLSLTKETDFSNLLMHVLDVGLKQADPVVNPGGRMCLLMDMKGQGDVQRWIQCFVSYACRCNTCLHVCDAC